MDIRSGMLELPATFARYDRATLMETCNLPIAHSRSELDQLLSPLSCEYRNRISKSRSNFCRILFGLLHRAGFEDRNQRDPGENRRDVNFPWPREYRGTRWEIKAGLWSFPAINDNIVGTAILSNSACLFFGLQRSLRTRISIVVSYQFESGTWRKRTFDLAALYRGSQARRTDVQRTGALLYIVWILNQARLNLRIFFIIQIHIRVSTCSAKLTESKQRRSTEFSANLLRLQRFI